MNSEQQGVLSILRQMILETELAPGQRVAEIPTAAKLGVSRTPIRIAFRTLEQEGLLEKLPGRGYRVRVLTEVDIRSAIEVRGVLEGLAAMQAAENGLSNELHQQLQQCLRRGDALFDQGHVSIGDLECYQQLNRQFHQGIVDASGNPAVAACLAKNAHFPFASSSALAIDPENLGREYKRFYFAHLQHHTVFDAIVNRQAARAEAIMREHANASINYAKIFTHHMQCGEGVRILGMKTSA